MSRRFRVPGWVSSSTCVPMATSWSSHFSIWSNFSSRVWPSSGTLLVGLPVSGWVKTTRPKGAPAVGS
jgi:hypothetical protein